MKEKHEFVDYYFQQLEYWKTQLKLKGYTQAVFQLAQKDVKKLPPNKDV